MYTRKIVWHLFLIFMVTILCLSMVESGHVYWIIVMFFEWVIGGIAIRSIIKEYRSKKAAPL